MEKEQQQLFFNLNELSVDELKTNKEKYLESITNINEQFSKKISDFLIEQKKIQKHVFFIEENKISDPNEKIFGIFSLPKFLLAINTENVEELKKHINSIKEGNIVIQENINVLTKQINNYLESFQTVKKQLDSFHSLKKQEEGNEKTTFSQSIEDFSQQMDIKIDSFNHFNKLVCVIEEINNKQAKFADIEEKRLKQLYANQALSSFNKLSSEMDNVLDKNLNNKNKNN